MFIISHIGLHRY